MIDYVLYVLIQIKLITNINKKKSPYDNWLHTDYKKFNIQLFFVEKYVCSLNNFYLLKKFVHLTYYVYWGIIYPIHIIYNVSEIDKRLFTNSVTDIKVPF